MSNESSVHQTNLPLGDAGHLLEFLNALPPEVPPCTLKDLTTGHRLWNILKHRDHAYFQGRLPEQLGASGSWLSKWQNLKHIYKTLCSYLTSMGCCIPSGPGQFGSVDLKSIATGEDHSEKEMTKLLKLVLCAIISRQEAPDFQNKTELMNALRSMSHTSNDPFIAITEEVMTFTQYVPTAESVPMEVSGETVPEMDRDLLYEQTLSKAKAEIEILQREKKDLQKELRELDNRHARLQENNEALQQELRVAHDHLRDEQYKGSEESVIRRLEARIQQQDDLIASQEAQLLDFQEQTDALSSDINQLRKANEKIQPLQDQLDEIRVQRDQLGKKANMLDKYRLKLQVTQELEKENQLLRGELEELQYEKGDGSQIRTQIAGLQKTIDEYQSTLEFLERERHEVGMMLKLRERDNGELEQELEDVREQLVKTQEELAEMRSGAPQSPLQGAEGGLALELEDSERKVALSPGEQVKQVQTELQETSAKAYMLEQFLEDTKERYSNLEKRYEELHLEKVALERGATGSSTTVKTSSPSPSKDDIPLMNALQKPDVEAYVTRQDEEIARLRERIKLMEAEDPGLKKVADIAFMRQELDVLRRETRLMSTAWYTLNSRLQWNSVILQRKSEAPRGLLRSARDQLESLAVVRNS